MTATEVDKLKFSEFRIKNFRAFEDARIRLADLTILVGRNGSGKSSVLEAIDFFRDALSDSLINALDRRGGLASVRRRQAARRPYDVSLAFQAKVGSATFVYGFRIGQTLGSEGSIAQVKEECLTNDSGLPGFRRNSTGITVQGLEAQPVLDSQSLILPIIAGQNPQWMQLYLGLRRLRTYTLSPTIIRQEPDVLDGKFLRRDGSNTGDVLKELEPDKLTMQWIVSHLSTITPGIQSIHADASSAGRRIIDFRRFGPGGVIQGFPSGLMSDGTLRCLAILLALRQKPPASLLVIDEIEDSVHPAAMAVLIDALRQSTDRSQIVITSHSPEALAHEAIKPENVRIVEWSDGTSKIFELAQKVVHSIQPPNSVGKLLRSNALWTEGEPATVGTRLFDCSE